MLLAGLGYLIIGRVFASPTTHVQAWRFAAWAVSGAVYGAQIAYEHVRLRNSRGSLAFHAALAAAIGAFGLAVAGPLHTYWATTGIRRSGLLALLLWPAITFVPAFVVALVAGVVLGYLLPRR